MAASPGIAQFLREVIASLVGNILSQPPSALAAELSPSLIDAFPELARRDDAGALGPTIPFTVTSPGTAVQLTQASQGSRKRLILEVRNPASPTAKAYLGGNADVNAARRTGIELPVGGKLIDEPPFQHQGEWWADADTSGTEIAVTPVS